MSAANQEHARDWKTHGSEHLVVQRPAAIQSLGPDWQAALARESLNYIELAEAIADVTCEQCCDPRVAIHAMSPLTELLADAFHSRGYEAVIDPGSFQTDATSMFQAPLDRNPQASVHAWAQLSPRPTKSIPDTRVWIDVHDDAVQSRYQTRIACHREALEQRLKPFRQSSKPTVFFFSKSAFYSQLRTSSALRAKGYQTVALVLDPNRRGHKSGFFDDIICTDLLSICLWLQAQSGILVHTQGWLFSHHLPLFIDAFLPPSCRQVVDLMDLNSFLFPASVMNKILDAMKIVWGSDVETLQAHQVACEAYIYQHADGVLFPGSSRHLDAFGVRGTKREDRFLQHLAYPIRAFFAPERVPKKVISPGIDPSLPRLVLAGGIIPVNDKHPKAIFADAQLISTARLLLTQGFSLQVFNNPLHAPLETYRYRYAEHLQLEREFAGYHFSIGAMPWDIPQKLCAFDLGLIAYDYSEVLLGEKHFENLLPAKLFMYLEAGLPVLVSRKARACAEYVEEHSFGVGVTDDELRKLPEFLRSVDLQKLRRGALKARDELCMDKKIDALIDFYTRIRALPVRAQSVA